MYAVLSLLVWHNLSVFPVWQIRRGLLINSDPLCLIRYLMFYSSITSELTTFVMNLGWQLKNQGNH